MIERQGGRLRVLAPMIMANAGGLLEAGRNALKDGQDVVDLQAVVQADSSALAVMLGWLRTALSRGTKLTFVNLPTGIRSLADLYGVAEILPLA